jgi:hypothetical protein
MATSPQQNTSKCILFLGNYILVTDMYYNQSISRDQCAETECMRM